MYACEVDTTLEVPFEDLLSFGAIRNRRGHLGWGLPFLFPLKTFAISIGKSAAEDSKMNRQGRCQQNTVTLIYSGKCGQSVSL